MARSRQKRAPRRIYEANPRFFVVVIIVIRARVRACARVSRNDAKSEKKIIIYNERKKAKNAYYGNTRKERARARARIVRDEKNNKSTTAYIYIRSTVRY